MTTVLAERFRAPVDGLTGPRIEDTLDVCVSATIDAPDPMKHPPGASFHRLTHADLECRRLASSNSEIRHRKKNPMTTTIAATAAKVALQARQVVRPLLRRGVGRSCKGRSAVVRGRR
jgi:hypothetical protein